MKVAFIYNPYQLLIIVGLMTDGVLIQRIIIPSKLKKLTNLLIKGKSIDVVVLKDAFVSDGKLQRLMALLHNLSKVTKFRCDQIFISNDQSILFLLALKAVNIKNITLIDEGALQQLILRERAMPSSPVEVLKQFFLGSYQRGKHPKIATLIVHEPKNNLWRDYGNKKVKNASRFANLGLQQIPIKERRENFRNKIVIATSPLTENGNSSYANQEKDIINKIVETNPKKNFVLKTHYRENEDKYEIIVKNNSNLTLMNEALDELPIQLFFSDIEIILGFHSSAVTQFGSKFPGNAFSMSGFVMSNHSENFVNTHPVGVRFLANYFI